MIYPEAIPVEQPGRERRFWWGILLVLGALFVATTFVVAQGSNATIRARRLMPEPGAAVSSRPHIRVTFARALEKGSVENAVSLLPTVPFDLSWAENELRILPRTFLRAGTTYTVTIGPNLRDLSGETLVGQLQWSFAVREPRLAYLRPVGEEGVELWATAVQGGPETAQRISAPDQRVQDYDSAPDGSIIVYNVEEGPNTINLWKVVPGQNGWSRLTTTTSVVYSAPRFGPTGDLLAVEIREETQLGDQGTRLGPPRLELRRPGDGSPAGLIYGGGPAVGHTPRWSPDGTRMAFFEPNKGAVGLFNFTADLRFFPAESANIGPQAWSPDGRALVYTLVHVSGDGAQQLMVVRDLEMGTEIPHAERVGNISDPAWSPDGELIAYAYQPPPGMGRGGEIWLTRPDGTGKVVLVAELGAIYTQPIWSPDGQWLAMSRFDLNNPNAPTQLWVIHRDGTKLHMVADAAFLPNWLP